MLFVYIWFGCGLMATIGFLFVHYYLDKESIRVRDIVDSLLFFAFGPMAIIGGLLFLFGEWYSENRNKVIIGRKDNE